MIHQLKTVFKPYVRSEADIDAWVDNGKPYMWGKTLMTSEEFVVNLKQVTANEHAVVAVAAKWYAENAGLITDEERYAGITYDISIINEDEYEIQFVFQMKRKFITDVDDNGVLSANECS